MVCLVLFRFLTTIWIFANLKKCYILRYKDYQMLNRFLTPGRGHTRDIDYCDISHCVTYTILVLVTCIAYIRLYSTGCY